MQLIEGLMGAGLAIFGIALMLGARFEFLGVFNDPDLDGVGTLSLGYALAGGGIMLVIHAIRTLFH